MSSRSIFSVSGSASDVSSLSSPNTSYRCTFGQLGVELDPTTDDLSGRDLHVRILAHLEDSMDFDPRDYDSRDEDHAPTRDRGGRGGSERDDEGDGEWSRSTGVSRDRDDEARNFGRGPGDSLESHSAERGRDAPDDARSPDRERHEGTRDTDPREVFTRRLNLPRGLDREVVRHRDRDYTLRGSESRTLAAVGAFRVVSSRDLRDHNGRSTDPPRAPTWAGPSTSTSARACTTASSAF
jgi:hypothetical protein